MSQAIEDMQTMVVPVELPRAILGEFIADQNARTARNLPWRTLEQWLQDKILTDVMVAHQQRIHTPQKGKRRYA